jgi:hypothetical protein
MTKANREAVRATRAALVLFTAVGLLVSMPAWAQPGDPSEQPQDPPGTDSQSEVQAAPAQPPPLLAPVQPRGYPYAYQQKPRATPQLTEPEGPVTTWEPLRFAVAFESRTTWLFDSGAKRVAGERAAMGAGVSLQGDVFRPSEQIAIRLDLGWVTASHMSYLAGTTLSEKLESNLFSLGASLRYHVLPWLAPFARLSGGMGWDKLTVAGLHDRQRFEQGSVGAGLFLRSPGLRLWQGPRSPALAIMGNLEGGYSLATGSDFALQAPSLSSSADPIPTNSVAIGHVGRNAPYLRASLGIAF